MLRIMTLLALLSSAVPALAVDRTVTMTIENMTCAACPIAVRTAMNAVPGVKEVKVDLQTKSAIISFDDAQASIDAIAEASRMAGFPASLKE